MEMLLQHSSLGVDPLLIYDWCCAMAQEMIICFGFVFRFISGTICKFRFRMWIACLLLHVTLYLSISWDAFNTGKCNRSNIIIACSTDYNDVCSYVASISSLTWSPTVAVGAMLEQLVPLPVYAPAEDKMIIVIKVNIWNEIRVPSTHNFRSTLVIISLSVSFLSKRFFLLLLFCIYFLQCHITIHRRRIPSQSAFRRMKTILMQHGSKTLKTVTNW